MKLKKIASPSLKDLFVKEIEGMILSGKIEIGDTLPSEREMATQMGVSRAVVTAGMSELSAKGFVEIRPRSGAVVADYRRKGTLETLVSIMNYNGGTFRQKDIQSIIEIRLALEKIMLEDLIPGITDEQLEEIGGLLGKLEASHGSDEIVENTFELHHELMVMSGNTLLPLIYYSFRVPISSLWARYTRLYGEHALYDNAKGLYEYMKKRDLEGALKWSQKYITASISGDREIYEG
ncbi:MAG: GntR family transcriptional regulator [Bacillota bacterium]|nr:GntR family transcriptional regulator [Bacillota bacterium]